VKQGDTLWDIAQLYPGVSADDILQWNGLIEPSKLKPGQIIKIKPRG
jgi:membrane-bound lytic murein transglycosylase D